GPVGRRTGHAPRGRQAPPRRSGRWSRSLPRQLVLVEDALVEARRQADVVDVALLEMDPAAELTAGNVVALPDQGLQEMRRLDRDRAPHTGHVEVRAVVPPQAGQHEARTAKRYRRTLLRPGD